MKCENQTNLTDWQYNQLIQHVKDNQYYLGEKLGHPVAWEQAEHDFFENYIKTVGKELRLTFCNTHCFVVDCSLRILFNNQ
jgi:hypothetical protein